jgi:hypothetical protein
LNQWASPNLDFTKVALHHSVEVSTTTSHKSNRGSFTIFLKGSGFTFSKPSRERQLPRVTNRWCLVEDSVVPQRSNSWCNALGCSYTLKNATTKQSEWETEEEASSIMSRKLSNVPRGPPIARQWGIYN